MPRPNAYAPVGEPYLGQQNWHAKGHLHVIGALLASGLLTVSLFSGSIHANTFYVWLAQNLLPKLSQGQVVMVMDNATFHKRADLRQLIQDTGYRLEYLPVYSLQLNTNGPNLRPFANRKFVPLRNFLHTMLGHHFIVLLIMLLLYSHPNTRKTKGPLLSNKLSLMNSNDFLDRSIGYFPPDVIRDGLPAFGTQRDDWKGTPRLHECHDIYIDNVNVLAASEGIVTKVVITSKASLYVKVQHDNHLATVYVHLKRSFVNKYQKVQQGEIIGRIEGPTGNAISAQLHFEIQKDHHSLDPLPLIESFYENNNEMTMKISQYKQLMLEYMKERARKVTEFLRSH